MQGIELKKKRVLFLDIDGVLNAWKSGTQRWYQQPSYPFIEPSVPLCTSLVENLQHIIAEVPDIGVVWSTSWRFNEDECYQKWRNPRLWLEKQKWFRKVLIGKNPMKMSSVRSEEIGFWLAENQWNKANLNKEFFSKQDHWKHFMNEPAYEVLNYAIVDDYLSDGMLRFGAEHLFTTQPNQGMSRAIANNIIKFLKTDAGDWQMPKGDDE